MAPSKTLNGLSNRRLRLGHSPISYAYGNPFRQAPWAQAMKRFAMAVVVAVSLASCGAATDAEPTSNPSDNSPSATSQGETKPNSGLTVIPQLMRTPRALAFYRMKSENDEPNSAWKVTSLDGTENQLGFTWGSHQINDSSGTGRGPAEGSFEIAGTELSLTPGDEIPILFDFRGLKPGQRIRISDGFGIEAEFQIFDQTGVFESPSQIELCNSSHMDLPVGSLLQRIDKLAPEPPFHKANCNEIPPGVYEVRQGRKLLTYVRR
jgi:hypothetical protein